MSGLLPAIHKTLISRTPRPGRRHPSLTLEPFHPFTSNASKRLSSAKLNHLFSITSTIPICKSFCLISIRTYPGGGGGYQRFTSHPQANRGLEPPCPDYPV